MAFGNGVVLGPSPVSVAFSGKAIVKEGVRIGGIRHSARGRMLGPMIHRGDGRVVSRCGRVMLSTRGCGLCFQMCGSKLTCHFRASFPSSLGMLGRRIVCYFPRSCGALFPRRHDVLSTRRPLFGPVGLSRVNASHFYDAPVLVGMSRGTHVFVDRSSLRDCPNVFLHGRNGGRLTNGFTTISLRSCGASSHRVFPAGHTSCVTHMGNAHGCP